jgi:hypothetical protein
MIGLWNSNWGGMHWPVGWGLRWNWSRRRRKPTGPGLLCLTLWASSDTRPQGHEVQPGLRLKQHGPGPRCNLQTWPIINLSFLKMCFSHVLSQQQKGWQTLSTYSSACVHVPTHTPVFTCINMHARTNAFAQVHTHISLLPCPVTLPALPSPSLAVISVAVASRSLKAPRKHNSFSFAEFPYFVENN